MIVDSTLTSLLSALVVVMIAALLRFTGKSLPRILLSRKSIMLLCFLALLILLMPIVFSFLKGTMLSPRELALYVEELLVSVVIVVSFSVTWRTFRASGLWAYVQTNRAQIVSLTKMLEGDTTGWYELLEDIQFGQGLRLGARLVARMALWSHSSDEYKKQLRLLLSYESGR
jgi:hypothetical protein